LRFELLELVESALQDLPIFTARQLRRNWIIEAIISHIPGAGSRIAGKLMNRKKGRPWFVEQNIFRPVSVVDIEVINRNAVDSSGQRFERRDRDIAEITKTHRL
jgi:hypothetical protein